MRSQSYVFAVLSALVLSVPAAAVTYDFTTPAADTALTGRALAFYESGGIPLGIQAGLLDHDGLFEPGVADAVLWAVPGSGLGVYSDVAFPDDALSMFEGIVFHFSPLFKARRLHLSEITLGGGEGDTFEAVRLFADGKYLLDRKGEPDGTLTIQLPPGITRLAVMPLLNPTQQIPTLSSDPLFYVAAIEGDAGAVGAAFDLRPGSCDGSFNTNSKGVLTAAILGTPAMNVSTINPASIRLAGVAPLRWSIEDVGRPGNCAGAPDGILDLVVKFDTQAVVRALRASLGTLRDGQRIVLPLEGRLRDGTIFVGEDQARLQVPGKGKR